MFKLIIYYSGVSTSPHPPTLPCDVSLSHVFELMEANSEEKYKNK